ncbi:hypothetical protein LshimejAT787_0307670 [Lyophyllum shimeji]|uniref:Uncharacterized protein n=1 Tax=Lyophyllum shimeji TaxID=47721 RepID=A0A9P3PJA1_LYOSH|nr:hypothetical protein LshimejAT787_0307670 [Lyophyllum shimeji]
MAVLSILTLQLCTASIPKISPILRRTRRPCSHPPCSPSHAHSHSRSWSPSGLIPQDFKLIDLEKGFQQEEPDSPCCCKTRSPQHLQASYLPVNALASPQTGCSLQFRAGQCRRRQLPNEDIPCNALPSSILRPLTCRVDLGRPRIDARILLPSSESRHHGEIKAGRAEGEGGSGELEQAQGAMCGQGAGSWGVAIVDRQKWIGSVDGGSARGRGGGTWSRRGKQEAGGEQGAEDGSHPTTSPWIIYRDSVLFDGVCTACYELGLISNDRHSAPSLLLA